MRLIKTRIKNQEHEVIYIEYQDAVPHSVVTKSYISNAKKPYWRTTQWDVFANDGDSENLMIYESGSGGEPTDISTPHYIESYKGASYWMGLGASFNSIPSNIIKLARPFNLGKNGDTIFNPFDICERTYSSEYCELCGHHSTEFCFEHKYDDENGDPRYIHNNEYAD